MNLVRRYYLVANLATQFIEQGVKTVIAAGRVVDDGAALTFAQIFYGTSLNGTGFGDGPGDDKADRGEYSS